jgi:carbon monoxide dehydrogenase subunit G
MKLDIGGVETIQAPVDVLWKALNDPTVLTRCIPGCKTMTEIARMPTRSRCSCASRRWVARSKARSRCLDKEPPKAQHQGFRRRHLGHWPAARASRSRRGGPTASRLTFQGAGEIGGLVAGVGQRILSSVSKHLVERFFTALRKEFETPVEGAAE